MSPNEVISFKKIILYFITSLAIVLVITVVLFSFLWLWVSENHEGTGIYHSIYTKLGNRTENNDYTVLIIETEPHKECPIEDARFTLFSADRRDMSNGQHQVSEITNKSIDNETFIVFQDNDGNGNISMGDFFIIKSIDHIDNDGNPSPGYAEPGMYFEIRGGDHWGKGDDWFGEIELK